MFFDIYAGHLEIHAKLVTVGTLQWLVEPMLSEIEIELYHYNSTNRSNIILGSKKLPLCEWEDFLLKGR